MTPCGSDGDEHEGAESLYKRRWAHIGNDAVHIVWCERMVDYDTSLLPTQVGFCILVTFPRSYPPPPSPSIFLPLFLILLLPLSPFVYCFIILFFLKLILILKYLVVWRDHARRVSFTEWYVSHTNPPQEAGPAVDRTSL